MACSPRRPQARRPGARTWTPRGSSRGSACGAPRARHPGPPPAPDLLASWHAGLLLLLLLSLKLGDLLSVTVGAARSRGVQHILSAFDAGSKRAQVCDLRTRGASLSVPSGEPGTVQEAALPCPPCPGQARKSRGPPPLQIPGSSLRAAQTPPRFWHPADVAAVSEAHFRRPGRSDSTRAGTHPKCGNWSRLHPPQIQGAPSPWPAQ